jgi:hypothetical protein
MGKQEHGFPSFFASTNPLLMSQNVFSESALEPQSNCQIPWHTYPKHKPISQLWLGDTSQTSWARIKPFYA